MPSNTSDKGKDVSGNSCTSSASSTLSSGCLGPSRPMVPGRLPFSLDLLPIFDPSAVNADVFRWTQRIRIVAGIYPDVGIAALLPLKLEGYAFTWYTCLLTDEGRNEVTADLDQFLSRLIRAFEAKTFGHFKACHNLKYHLGEDYPAYHWEKVYRAHRAGYGDPDLIAMELKDGVPASMRLCVITAMTREGNELEKLTPIFRDVAILVTKTEHERVEMMRSLAEGDAALSDAGSPEEHHDAARLGTGNPATSIRARQADVEDGGQDDC